MTQKTIINTKDVQYVATLARIHLEDSAAEALTKDLEKILKYVEQLTELDVTDVAPTSHVLPLKNVSREDTVTPLLTQNEALSIAVEKKDNCFKVPRVIE